MRRGPKPAKSKEAKPPVARKSPKDDGSRVRDLEKRLAEALKREAEALRKLQARDGELVDAHEQQAATSEILGVISSSPTDVQPVLDAISHQAMRLCSASYGVVTRYDGELLHLAAHAHVRREGVEAMKRLFPTRPSRATTSSRAVLERGVVHVPDALADPDYDKSVARGLQNRSVLAVPMLRRGEPIGTISVGRFEPQPFTDTQIALLQTFADQAVIAIENVRLFNETHEALDQQTATSEILRVIASSPTDVQPVFDAIAEAAMRLCGAHSSLVTTFDGELLHLVAQADISPEGREVVRGVYPRRPSRGSASGRSLLTRAIVQIPDVTADPEYDVRVVPRVRDFRSILAVPMLRDGLPIGTINAHKAQPGPFTDKQVALLQTFADQAVIAIENVRLFTELEARNRQLTETLEQQTATSEILRVISGSPTNIQPVFDTIVKSVARLCDGMFATLHRFDGELLHWVAQHNYTAEGLEAMREAYPMRADRDTASGRAVIDRTVIHVRDFEGDPDVPPRSRTIARAFGYRSLVTVPMLREGQPVGAIAVARRDSPFSAGQITLLQTFADQAVIAIENVRLFNETKEALERQTATAEILRVISSSPADVQPVFDVVLASGVRLCGARFGGVFRFDGELVHLVTSYEWPPEQLEAVRRLFPMPPGDGSLIARAIRDRCVVQTPDYVADARAGAMLPEWVPKGEQRPRSTIAVPMLREGSPLGGIVLARAEPGLFSDKHVSLLQTFADQAVIAIENVRLFNETKEALEQQTATSDILRVISGSPTDVQPVFDAIAESAARLCEGIFGMVYRLDGDTVHMVAHHNVSPEGWAAYQALYPRPLSRQTNSGRAMLDGRVAITEDVEADTERSAATRHAARLVGLRSAVTVPLLREERTIGALTVGRDEPGTFTPKQVALLRTFADQAVIAIENVRLFTELQERNRAVTQAHAQVSEALEQQTATAEILRVISRSQTDVQPVFDAIVTSAVRLLAGYGGSLTRVAGDQLELAALTSTDAVGDAAQRARFPMSIRSEGVHPTVIRHRAPVNIADAYTDPRVPEGGRAIARARGYRSLAGVPLLRHDEAIGTIAVIRREPGGFTDDEIALLQTFADQAVIAIENARLLTELHARTAELTQSVGELRALGEVGQAISSTLDLQTVLSTIVARATQLSGTDAGVIYEYDEQREIFLPRATAHLEAEIVETMLATPVRKGEGATGRLAEVQEPIQVPDILAAPAESRVRSALVRAGYRALLAIPLVREDHLLGGLTVIRKATGAFAPETIELLQTFATQSSLAIQNARLFLEIEDKSRQLEVASQHKSEFLANMSHELRTPLNAIIGFSEVLTERMFGELNEKQDEYLKDIYASGQHLLSLINDILDLSKIEAGRMELELTDFHFPTALDSALTLVRERAGRRGIALQMNVDSRLGQIQADERKVRQVVLNLLSNAIKFTPEGGSIEIRAVPRDGSVEVSVTDTGVGIAPEDQEAVFEEFRQVGTADKKVEGTGLGLTLCRKFIELHGGRIWVKSQVGAGSTFTFTIPVRCGE